MLNNVFGPVIKSDNGQMGSGGGANRSFDGSEMGLCLALRVVANLLCASDQPFTLPDEAGQRTERLMETGRRQTTADLRSLRVVQMREMDLLIMPTLSAICILIDQVGWVGVEFWKFVDLDFSKLEFLKSSQLNPNPPLAPRPNAASPPSPATPTASANFSESPSAPCWPSASKSGSCSACSVCVTPGRRWTHFD